MELKPNCRKNSLNDSFLNNNKKTTLYSVEYVEKNKKNIAIL